MALSSSPADPSHTPRRAACRRSWFTAALFASAVFTGQATARADDSAAADALFQQGKRLASENKFAEACPKFEASYKLERTLGTLLNLADCHEKVGKIATAWAEWGEAAERAERDGDKRLDFAKQHREALTSRLPNLEIAVGRPVSTLEVYRDDSRVDPGVFNVALPVDPGAHTVTVRRGDQVLRKEAVRLEEKGSAKVLLDLEAIDKSAPAPVGTQAPSESPGTSSQPSSSGGQKTVGFVLGGVGLAALAGATVLEIVALSTKPGKDDTSSCVQRFCTPAGFDDVEKARTFANVGQWVGIGGIVVLAVGITLVITAPSRSTASRSAGAILQQPVSRADASRAWAAPWASPSAAGVLVGGRL